MRAFLALLLMLASPAGADIGTALDRIGAGYKDFARATRALDMAAQQDCQGLAPAFHAAWDAWLAVGQIHIGPAEDGGRALAVVFWPDPKGSGARAQRGLLTGDPADLTPTRFAAQSVAARGLTGLERLLWPAAPLPADPCRLIRATTADLARNAGEMAAEWPGFAPLLASPGGDGNTRYLTPAESAQALITQLVTGLEYTADQRIGRPLGTEAQPRPERAEARASQRSQRNVDLALQAARALARDLAPEAEASIAALNRAIYLAGHLDDPVFDATATPDGWRQLQTLQSAIRAARTQVLAEIAPALGAGLGFNALDGD